MSRVLTDAFRPLVVCVIVCVIPENFSCCGLKTQVATCSLVGWRRGWASLWPFGSSFYSVCFCATIDHPGGFGGRVVSTEFPFPYTMSVVDRVDLDCDDPNRRCLLTLHELIGDVDDSVAPSDVAMPSRTVPALSLHELVGGVDDLRAPSDVATPSRTMSDLDVADVADVLDAVDVVGGVNVVDVVHVDAADNVDVASAVDANVVDVVDAADATGRRQ